MHYGGNLIIKVQSTFKNNFRLSDVNCAFPPTGSRNHRQRKDNDNEPLHREQGELFGEKEGAPSESDLGSCWRRGPQCDQGKQDLSGVLQPPRKVAHINIEKLLQDLLHKDQAWPAWMDTVGLDEGDAEHVNGELVHKYLLFEARDIQDVILDSCLLSSQSEVLRSGNTC